MQISHQPYTLENKNVFSLDLKILTEEACLMDSGKAFQSLGGSNTESTISPAIKPRLRGKQ